MEKINIAEILKHCPKGMELDCVMFDNVTFEEVVNIVDEEGNEEDFPIVVKVGDKDSISLTKYGEYHNNDINSKCVIFPKGKTTWEEFVPPYEFKDGDILSYQLKGFENRSIYIYKQRSRLNTSYYVALNCNLELLIAPEDGYALSGHDDSVRLATEEEKQKLFYAIKENGYRWNSETKTLEKLFKPKFKVGDKIVNSHILRNNIGASVTDSVIISEITEDQYIFSDNSFIFISNQDEFELVPDKFDITTYMKTIYKIEITERGMFFHVGYENVIAIIEKTKITSSCAETESASSKLYYQVLFSDGSTIELYADIKGMIIYRR